MSLYKYNLILKSFKMLLNSNVILNGYISCIYILYIYTYRKREVLLLILSRDESDLSREDRAEKEVLGFSNTCSSYRFNVVVTLLDIIAVEY